MYETEVWLPMSIVTCLFMADSKSLNSRTSFAVVLLLDLVDPITGFLGSHALVLVFEAHLDFIRNRHRDSLDFTGWIVMTVDVKGHLYLMVSRLRVVHLLSGKMPPKVMHHVSHYGRLTSKNHLVAIRVYPNPGCDVLSDQGEHGTIPDSQLVPELFLYLCEVSLGLGHGNILAVLIHVFKGQRALNL